LLNLALRRTLAAPARARSSTKNLVNIHVNNKNVFDTIVFELVYSNMSTTAAAREHA
jgi:hypothetical protein